MSGKSSLRYTNDFHLYTDALDDFQGPHVYLRIDNGLVKRIEVSSGERGISVLVRIPPEVYSIFHPEIVRELRRRARLFDPKRLNRAIDRMVRDSRRPPKSPIRRKRVSVRASR